MATRATARSIFPHTTKTAGPSEFFIKGGGGVVVTGMIDVDLWSDPKYIPRAWNLRAHYNEVVIPDQMEFYACNIQTPSPRLNYTELKNEIEQRYRNLPDCNISYSDLMDTFPSADLMDIFRICSELVEEGKIAEVEA